MRKIKWGNENIEFLKLNYPNGNINDILLKFNITIDSLRGIVKKHKIKRLNPTEQNLFKLRKLYDDNIINYYWYGFIMSDGHITNGGELVLKLHQKDIKHLVKINKLINVKIHRKEELTQYGLSKHCFLRCKDSKYGKLLKEKLNIDNNKTINPPNLDFIDNKEKFIGFFAGFIDGDGCVCYRKNKKYMIRIQCHSNWIDNLIFFKDKLKEYINIESRAYLDKKGYSTFAVTKNCDIENIKDIFLKYKLPIMERKWFIGNELRTYKINKLLKHGCKN